MSITADAINSVCLDMIDIAIDRLGLDEKQVDELLKDMEEMFYKYFDYPDYSNYN
jgi:hypothetical protein